MVSSWYEGFETGCIAYKAKLGTVNFFLYAWHWWMLPVAADRESAYLDDNVSIKHSADTQHVADVTRDM